MTKAIMQKIKQVWQSNNAKNKARMTKGTIQSIKQEIIKYKNAIK